MAKADVTKKAYEKLREQLEYKTTLVWDTVSATAKKKIFSFGGAYKSFLDEAKTEREAVDFIRQTALKKGFSANGASERDQPFLKVWHDKSIALVRPGDPSYRGGIRLIVSHIDSPRLDLKQRPLYEEADLSFLKTHYYGGIKHFQWLARPLALHGRVIRKDGSHVDLSVGEDPSDPVFTILDLLPHLAKKVQYEKKLEEAIPGEKLNVLVGSLPLGDEEVKDRFKFAILDYLHQQYGIVEEDLISSELEVVPAQNARDVGWDRGLVGAYGQDDRICAFASLMALLDMKENAVPSVTLFVDKEEIGSDGATGAKSLFLEAVILDLLEFKRQRQEPGIVRRVLAASKALSGDVTGGFDPDYPEVHEKRNAAMLGYGVCMTKFTGHGGKIGANDANAEYVGWLRKLFNSKNVTWQTGELGKVGAGGGGTVAKFLSVYGMETIDCGPPVLSMHSPFEIAHKGDLYMTYKGYKAFLEAPAD